MLLGKAFYNSTNNVFLLECEGKSKGERKDGKKEGRQPPLPLSESVVEDIFFVTAKGCTINLLNVSYINSFVFKQQRKFL